MFLAYLLDKKEEKIRSFSFGFLPDGPSLRSRHRPGDERTRFWGSSLSHDHGLSPSLRQRGQGDLSRRGLPWLAIPVVYYLVMNVGYRYKSLMGFIRPWDDPGNTSFQIIQSFLFFRFRRTLRPRIG